MDIYKIPKFLETILNHLNNAWAKKEIKGEIKTIFNLVKIQHIRIYEMLQK